jgi:hypothetical protein
MPGSKFRSSLKEKLSGHPSEQTYSINTFEWSGANSFIERGQAAASLAERLDSDAVAHPSQQHILIGHSHGGTVCMLAMKHVKTAMPNIVTLATPFIELDESGIRPRFSTPRFFSDLFRALSICVFFFYVGLMFWSLVAAIIASLTRPDITPRRLDFPYTDAFMLLPYAWLQHPSIAQLLSLPIGLIGYLAAFEWPQHTLDMHWALGGLIQARPSTSMLVLRGIDDEATLALTAGAIGNRLTEPLTKVVILVILISLLTLAASLTGVVLISDEHAQQLHGLTLGVIPFLWIIDVVAGCCKAVYGREMVAWSLGLAVRSHSSPDHSGNLSIATVPYKGSRGFFRHAIYDHEATVETIKIWITDGFVFRVVDT